jgi:hypothetical protein
MPLGELSDMVDAFLILSGAADEAAPEDNYIPNLR